MGILDGYNIISPEIAERIRLNIRFTVLQTYRGQYDALLNELDYLEYLYRQFQRGGTTQETPCETLDSS